MISALLYGLLAWFLYNLVFRFIIPLWRTSREVRKKFRQMHEQMNQQQQGYQNSAPNGTAQPKRPDTSSAPKKGDYIDFEEIK